MMNKKAVIEYLANLGEKSWEEVCLSVEKMKSNRAKIEENNILFEKIKEKYKDYKPGWYLEYKHGEPHMYRKLEKIIEDYLSGGEKRLLGKFSAFVIVDELGEIKNYQKIDYYKIIELDSDKNILSVKRDLKESEVKTMIDEF